MVVSHWDLWLICYCSITEPQLTAISSAVCHSWYYLHSELGHQIAAAVPGITSCMMKTRNRPSVLSVFCKNKGHFNETQEDFLSCLICCMRTMDTWNNVYVQLERKSRGRERGSAPGLPRAQGCGHTGLPGVAWWFSVPRRLLNNRTSIIINSSN